MSVDACITQKADAGIVNRKKATSVAKRFREGVAELMNESGLTEIEATRLIAQRLETDAEREMARKRIMAIRQVQVQSDLRAAVAKARAEGRDANQAVMSYLSADPRERAIGPDLANRIRIVRGEAHAAMADFLEKFRSKAAGFSHRLDGIDDVIRELQGEDSGNGAAKAMAGGLREAVETMRKRFNANGGDIVLREDWGWFHMHNPSAIQAANKADYVNEVMDLLNIEKMLDQNGNPMTRKQVFAAINEAYDSIATYGVSDLAGPRGPNLFGSSVNKRANHRFFVFKDADAWMKYHKKYGQGNLFDIITGGLHQLARETAILEVMGPHPEATLRFMEQLVDEARGATAVAGTGRQASAAGAAIGRQHAVRALYDTVTGQSAMNGATTAAGQIAGEVSAANRNILVSSHLGMAWFSALADLPLQAITAKYNGLSAAKVIGRHLKTFSTNSTADRKLAIQLGFTGEGWSSRAIGAQRLLGEVTGPEFTERIADTTLRLGLLSPWTESGRYAFQTEMLAHITNQTNRKFADLDKATRGTFERYGLDANDWDLIRNTQKWVDPESGAEFIRASDVRGLDFDSPAAEAANKLQAAIFNETGFAVVSTTPRVRAMLTGGAPVGTFWGEVMRNSVMFKGFPITILHLHWQRLLSMKNPKSAAQYAAFLMLAMTSVGAISEQMANIANGKDPASMDSGKFWAKAAMRGGSTGLFGDLVFHDYNRFGGGLVDGLLGPVAGQVDDLAGLTLGNTQQLLSGDDTHAGRELSRFIQSMTPGRSLWYTKLAMERLVFDEMDWALDPEAHQGFSRVEQRARDEFDQEFFWRPGETRAERMPNMGAAFGR